MPQPEEPHDQDFRHAGSRAGSQTSSINDRGANYFFARACLNKERKRTKKKELWKGTLVETAAVEEIE